MSKLLESIDAVGELFNLSEGHEKKHNPFRHHSKLGNKTPRSRNGADEVEKWECTKKGAYLQVCKGVGPGNEGRTKIVHVDPSWKKQYNAEYKKGMASGKYVPAVRSGGTKKAKKAKLSSHE
jgi:hypothetical protein